MHVTLAPTHGVSLDSKARWQAQDKSHYSCIPAGAAIGILPKIESADSVGHLSDILDAADGAMVARGDLGAELPVQEVSVVHCLLPHQAHMLSCPGKP